MALRPGKQRLSATPIIAKGVLYPLQNPRASKLATHGFASKSDTRHKNPKAMLSDFSFVSAGHNIICVQRTQHHLSPGSTSFRRKADTNERGCTSCK